MKTLDEVIKAIEWCTEHDKSGCSACPYADDDNRCYEDDALHYLKHLQEYYEMSREHHEPNPPLSWDELRTMTGKPVWVEGGVTGYWDIVKSVTETWMHCVLDGWRKETHGTEWQAYRKENGRTNGDRSAEKPV